MAILLAFLGLLAVTSASVLQPRIVNGTEAEPGQFPFEVSIQWKTTLYHICGGSIINENYILSSANCLKYEKAWNLMIIAGTVRHDRPSVLKYVDEIIFHEKYNPENPHVHDIALLKVKSPFVFNDLLRPIPVAGPADSSKNGASAVVAGWGPISEGEITSKFLLFTNVEVSDQEECKKAYEEKDEVVLDTQLCARSTGKVTGPCFTDEGGPMIIDGKVHGIILWFNQCNLKDMPVIYTRVSSYHDWIVTKSV